MFTLLDIYNKILTDLKEDPTAPVFWTETEIKDIINESLRHISEFVTLKKARDTKNFQDGVNSYNLPDDYANEILRVDINGENIFPNVMLYEDLDPSATGLPTAWGFDSINSIFFNCTSTSSQVADEYTVWYRAHYGDLSDDTDTIPKISVLRDAVIAYSKYRARMKEGDGKNITQAKEFLAEANSNIDTLIIRDSSNNGSISMGMNQ